MKSLLQRWSGRAASAAERGQKTAIEPMRELALDEVDELLVAGVGLAQDTWGAAQVSRDASQLAWSLLPPLPAAVAR